jgi:hypothetical protein
MDQIIRDLAQSVAALTTNVNAMATAQTQYMQAVAAIPQLPAAGAQQLANAIDINNVAAIATAVQTAVAA